MWNTLTINCSTYEGCFCRLSFFKLEKAPTSELFGTHSNFSPRRAKLRRIIHKETATNPWRLRITEAHNVNFQLIKSGIKSNECAQGGYLKLRIIQKNPYRWELGAFPNKHDYFVILQTLEKWGASCEGEAGGRVAPSSRVSSSLAPHVSYTSISYLKSSSRTAHARLIFPTAA